MAELGYITFAAPSIGGLAAIIYWLIGITSSIAAGVILFTVILKLVTFPFDLYSRISMRKNSLKMEEMRPELEKLQKQYADDKVLYNQKMMALYKKNGYSLWGSCLPTIVTLVIFIVAISAFTNYSQYQNRKYFYDMSLAYNFVIYDGLDKDGEYIKIEDGKLIINDVALIAKLEGTSEGDVVEVSETNIKVENTHVKADENSAESRYTVWTEGGYTKYVAEYAKDGDAYKIGTVKFYIMDGTQEVPEEYKTAYDADRADENKKSTRLDTLEADYVRHLCREKSAETFREENASFLWVKNIFMSDSALVHPIYEKWSDFKSNYKYNDNETQGKAGAMDDAKYAELIYNLDAEKTEPNGYFILVALTAGVSLLLQLITSKANKAQMELQTVDGQGAQTQKIMTWMMPIMMAVFAFMYTAAFSIYVVLSSLISLGTTLGINWIIDKKYKSASKEGKKETIRGRIYVPKQEEPKEEPKKKNDKNKIQDNDFLSGLADKKRGKKK